MRSNIFWISVLGSLVMISLLAMVFVNGAAGGEQGAVARIYSGGELVEIIDLAASAYQHNTTETIEINSGRGRNVIEVGGGGIRMLEADCDNNVCVRQGWVMSGHVLIVCLPHNVVIEVEGGGLDIDGIVG